MVDSRYKRKNLLGHREKDEKYSGKVFLMDLLRLLFLLCGLFGVITALHKFPGLEFDRTKLFLYSGGLMAALYILFRIHEGIFALVTSIGIILLGRQIYIAREPLLAQCDRIYDWFMAIEQSTGDVTELFLYGALVLGIFIFIMDIVLRLHLPSYVLISLTLVLAPLFGSKLGPAEILTVGAFQFFFFADSKTARGLKTAFNSSGRRSAIALKSSIAAVLLLGISLLIALPITTKYEDKIYETAMNIEEKIEDAFDATFSDDDGLINRGSNFHSGEKVFTAVSVREPSESIYLIRYRGGSYDNSRWDPIDEETFMENTATSYEVSLQDIKSLFNTLYFQWNYVGVSGVDSNVRQLSIISPEAKYVSMRPYFAIRPETSTQGEDGNYRSLYYYYEERELTELPDDTEKGWAGMSSLANLYGDFAFSNYTDYPERQIPNLSQLVRENPLEDLNDITSFIIYTLGSHAKYTIKPGMAPFNRDITEHFLFNSGLGYCQHYASTAALMYRMYGIPARYVTGYRLDPDDYSLQDIKVIFGESEGEESLAYVADIPDSSAHAWVEIFIKGYGWCPVEVTPSVNGEFYPRYPGFGPEVMESIQRAHGWILDPEEVEIVEEAPLAEIFPEEPSEEEAPFNQQEEELIPQTAENPETQENSTENLFPDLIPEAEIEENQAEPDVNHYSQAFKGFGSFMLKLLYWLLGLGIVAACFFLYRRYSLKQNQEADVKVLFKKLLKMLSDCGLTLPQRMDDPSIPTLISEFLMDEEGYSPISLSQAKSIQDIVTGATFSNHPIAEEDRSLVYNLYMDSAKKLYDEQSWFNRLIFRYVKVYL